MPTAKKPKKNKPRILTVDIETAPGLGYFWRLFDENISLDQLVDPGGPICVAWQWVGEAKVHFDATWLHDDPLAWLKSIHAALKEADAVVTFNGDKFDLPKLNGMFILAGLPPLPQITSIDLRKTTKKLGLISGKLQHALEFYKIGKKLEHEGFRLWRRVLEGDEKARRKMERYNKQDTRETTKAYLFFRPYIHNHPHMHMHGDCPICGSVNIRSNGWRRSRAMKYQRLQCLDCGHPFKGKGSKV
jgi:hypothetical protein